MSVKKENKIRLGQSIHYNNSNYTVIGVKPKMFLDPDHAARWREWDIMIGSTAHACPSRFWHIANDQSNIKTYPFNYIHNIKDFRYALMIYSNEIQPE